jgi:hypothetical protein
MLLAFQSKKLIQDELKYITTDTKAADDIVRERARLSRLNPQLVLWIYIKLPVLNEIAEDFEKLEAHISRIVTNFIIPEQLSNIQESNGTRRGLSDRLAVANVDFEKWPDSPKFL